MVSHPMVPTYDSLINPTFQALRILGGSGNVDEILQKVSEIAKLTDEQLSIAHKDDGGRIEVEYRLAWVRTYLKKYGILENSSRGVWSITPKGRNLSQVDPKDVMTYVRSLKTTLDTADITDIEPPTESEPEVKWADKVLELLLKMDPSAFERFCQRLLREAGFTQVNVTGKTGDGGIDGTGIIRINGFISFPVVFQCKRYQGSVTASQVRDFRGAMIGRADKGLIITTGTFTKDAVKEATRDGAPVIDLVDGDQLPMRLKDLRLGIQTETVERVTVIESWFSTV